MSTIAEPAARSAASSISFITLGCAKNEVDSDKMKAQVLAAGFLVTEDPEQADVLIINTCAFLTEASEESLSAIFQALSLDSISEGSGKLVVAGCLPSRYREELYGELPEVAAFLPTDEEDSIVDVLKRILSTTEEPEATACPAGEGICARDDSVEEVSEPGLMRTVDKPWAYVKISDGCDRFCSFCTIPFIRGRYKSRPAKEISAEIDGLVANGVREIILIGQDTGIWGRDLTAPNRDIACPDNGSDPVNLAQLLDSLARSHPKTWIRVMYLQPLGVTDELLDVMSKHENICKYLDIPLQHASKRILKEMNRTGSGPEFLGLLDRIRTALPGVSLRTTVIAGFPGETRADFKELKDFLTQARFDYVGVFSYSQEDGTKAGERSDQVPVRTRRARAQRLRDLVDQIGFELNELKIDSVCDVLICEREEDELADELDIGESYNADSVQSALGFIARTQGQAPDVDGMVHLEEGDIGTIVSVSITGAYCYELEAGILGVAGK